MGFVMLGIATLTEIGIQAAIFGMVAHGIITGMLFFCVGSIYDRYHTREIAEIGGGMVQKMPKLAGIFAFVSIASLGLPGLAGFWGEVMALLSLVQPERGARPRRRAVPGLHGVGGIGTILTAGYFLWMLQRVNMGMLPERWKDEPFRDMLDGRVGLVGAAAGADRGRSACYPRLVFGVTDEAVDGCSPA